MYTLTLFGTVGPEGEIIPNVLTTSSRKTAVKIFRLMNFRNIQWSKSSGIYVSIYKNCRKYGDRI